MQSLLYYSSGSILLVANQTYTGTLNSQIMARIVDIVGKSKTIEFSILEN